MHHLIRRNVKPWGRSDTFIRGPSTDGPMVDDVGVVLQGYVEALYLPVSHLI